MALNTEASAALVFLILYVILFLLMSFGYATRRLRFASRYTIVFFHVIVRLASQGTGLAFGIVGYSAIDLLVAYFILGTISDPFAFVFLRGIFQARKDTSPLCSAPTVSLSRGSVLIPKSMTPGWNGNIHRAHPYS